MLSASKITLLEQGAFRDLGIAAVVSQQPRPSRASHVVVRASKTSDDEHIGRRAALAGLAAAVIAVGNDIGGGANAAAPPIEKKAPAPKKDYYQELLSLKKPEVSLEEYNQVKNGKKGKGKPKSKSPSTTAKRSNTAPKKAAAAASSSSVAAINPIEVGVGLAVVGAAGYLGNKSTSRASAGASTAKRSASPPRLAPKVPVTRPGTLRIAAGTKKVAAPATVRVGTKALKPAPPAPKRAVGGTKAVKAAPAKKGSKAADAGDDDAAGTGALIGVGVAGLAAAAFLVAGNAGGDKAAAPNAPAAKTVKVDANATTPKPAAPVAEVVVAPKVVSAPAAPAPKPEVSKPTAVAATPAPATAPVAAASTATTTGVPPVNPQTLVIAGLGALVVAGAASSGNNSSESTTGSSSTSAAAAGSSSSEEQDAQKRAAEARAWIDAWKAKQQK